MVAQLPPPFPYVRVTSNALAHTHLVIGAGLWSASLGLAFNPNDHASRYPVWFLLDSNPQPGFSALPGTSEWSAGVWVSMGAGHMIAYAAIGLR